MDLGQNKDQKQEELKLPLLNVDSLDKIIIKDDQVMSVANMKIGKIQLLSRSSSSSMHHIIKRIGKNIADYLPGDEIIGFRSSPLAYEWTNPITDERNMVLISDKYNIDLVIRS